MRRSSPAGRRGTVVAALAAVAALVLLLAGPVDARRALLSGGGNGGSGGNGGNGGSGGGSSGGGSGNLKPSPPPSPPPSPLPPSPPPPRDGMPNSCGSNLCFFPNTASEWVVKQHKDGSNYNAYPTRNGLTSVFTIRVENDDKVADGRSFGATCERHNDGMEPCTNYKKCIANDVRQEVTFFQVDVPDSCKPYVDTSDLDDDQVVTRKVVFFKLVIRGAFVTQVGDVGFVVGNEHRFTKGSITGPIECVPPPPPSPSGTTIESGPAPAPKAYSSIDGKIALTFGSDDLYKFECSTGSKIATVALLVNGAAVDTSPVDSDGEFFFPSSESKPLYLAPGDKVELSVANLANQFSKDLPDFFSVDGEQKKGAAASFEVVVEGSSYGVVLRYTRKFNVRTFVQYDHRAHLPSWAHLNLPAVPGASHVKLMFDGDDVEYTGAPVELWNRFPKSFKDDKPGFQVRVVPDKSAFNLNGGTYFLSSDALAAKACEAEDFFLDIQANATLDKVQIKGHAGWVFGKKVSLEGRTLCPVEVHLKHPATGAVLASASTEDEGAYSFSLPMVPGSEMQAQLVKGPAHTWAVETGSITVSPDARDYVVSGDLTMTRDFELAGSFGIHSKVVEEEDAVDLNGACPSADFETITITTGNRVWARLGRV
ncbi:hypothetical protein HXX76_003004 [Chlamydomonas incerta]|uniref:Uncharacterized protein n=1 Tax=Chlamydomonas incerta TaxID=51695 RepID=A0A835TD49_CHLIN|nr:hypothetical protein HXX76_003004 [Chlamydomonas incerta]|eukprot:KAG2442928.1 hypothetical protein HXX76_003004 [Chlamydomonas incerta]